jgi:hypothetical protein
MHCCTYTTATQNGNGEVGAAVLLGKPKKTRMFAKSLREVESLRLDQRRRLMEVYTCKLCYYADVCTMLCNYQVLQQAPNALSCATDFAMLVSAHSARYQHKAVKVLAFALRFK